MGGRWSVKRAKVLKEKQRTHRDSTPAQYNGCTPVVVMWVCGWVSVHAAKRVWSPILSQCENVLFVGLANAAHQERRKSAINLITSFLLSSFL
jgi:hypothetical protein